MLGEAAGGAGPAAEDLITVTIVRDEHGYGMKVSGDNPVYVQSVKESGAAWRAGLRAGDRILRVGSVPVHHHTHQQVVTMIRANPTTVLTVQQNLSRHKTPITAPVPVNSEKQRQLEVSKAQTVRLMLEQEQKYIRDLRDELSKVPDVRKQAQLAAAEHRCAKLQQEIDSITQGQGEDSTPPAVGTPRSTRAKAVSPQNNTGFLSGLPRSLSNLTGQSLRNLRQARQKTQETPPALVRQNSDDSGKRRHVHNNTVPMVTTCLDNVSPPPLPPRSIERPKSHRSPLTSNMSPPVNPLAKPKPCTSASPIHNQYRRYYPMHQSVPSYNDKLKRSSQSLDGELDGPQPNSIAMQMSYPLVNAPPPPLQTDNRSNVPVLHVRSQSSPEHLDHELAKPGVSEKDWRERPPGTPPPPYRHNTQPCADPQRAIISMEEDDSPASDNLTYSGLFSNLRSVRESKARTAVLLNWLLGERRCACACLLLVVSDGFRAAAGVTTGALRRWAYEIHSTFLMPNAVLQLNGVDENMANEIEHVLVNEWEKEELLRNVFRKARVVAKEELTSQLSEFQLKRQSGLGALYSPPDHLIHKADKDKAQELVVVENLLCQRLTAICQGAAAGCFASGTSASGTSASKTSASPEEAHQALVAALIAAALTLHCRPASVAAAVGGSRASFLQRDKLYKQRVKQLTKQHPQPFVVRGHHLQLQALTSVGHCHHCDHVIWGLAPQAYVCTDCKLRVHVPCARSVEEGCCLDGEHHNNRISRFMERIHHTPNSSQDSNEKKSKKSSGAGTFLNMERSYRKMEDEQPWEQTLTPNQDRRDESDESLYESADCHSDAISASDDAIPTRLGKTPTMSKESLKLAVTDEEVDLKNNKKGHRKAMSLSNPLEIVKNFGDEWFDSTKREMDKNSDKKKSRESLWSEEDRDSNHGSTLKLDQIRKTSKKEKDNHQDSVKSRNSVTMDPPKPRKSSKSSSVSALNFLRRKKTPTSMKTIEAVAESVGRMITTDEILNYTKDFLEEEKRYSAVRDSKPVIETDDSDEELPAPKPTGDHRRRLSRQTSRSKSKVRGKSQTVKVNTLRKSHSGTLKKSKKKGVKTPLAGRSRQASVVETPILKKRADVKHNSWFSVKGETRREGSTEEPPSTDVDAEDTVQKENRDKDNICRAAAARGVNRAESCRERDAPRRGKHRNASDPNRLTAHNHHDLEPGAATAPSGSSSSSSLSSRSNESNTAAAPDQQASQSDLSEEDEPLAAAWADSLPPDRLDAVQLSARARKRQEVIHELIVSEGSHVRWLKVLYSVFLKPLQRQPTLLPPDELKALLPNLPGVHDRHKRLYADLRALRNKEECVVPIGAVADAMLSTLGEPGYASCLSRFCRNQRMSLDALRERRRKHKELHQYLAAREQLPLCGRLQLRDLLACVWQRLTKYQLLLESILKTVPEDEGDDKESPEDVAKLKKAIDVAKDVVQNVDAAIRTSENEHRLRYIQGRLEARVPGGAEWEEARRLDLTRRALRHEGDLLLRTDTNKRTTTLGLMLEECLVLLVREGDKFVLKPIAQPSGGQQGLLTPLIKWDKVLFRPNAAVRNTFFLMNINGVQMHELSTNTNAEYATWVKHIQELPLAKPELKPTLTPSHQPSRSTDDSGINVSRNPSDASEKSTSTVPADEQETERDRQSVERSASETERDRVEREKSGERERERQSVEKEETVEREEKQNRRSTVGRVCRHRSPPPPLLPPPTVLPPAAAYTATTAITNQERLRRLDSRIQSALQEKCAIVSEVLGLGGDYRIVAELAEADTRGDLDLSTEFRQSLLSRTNSEEENPDLSSPNIHQLLLTALTQANQITERLSASMTLDESSSMTGRCDDCARSRHRRQETPKQSKKLESRSDTETSEATEESGESGESRESGARGEWCRGGGGGGGGDLHHLGGRCPSPAQLAAQSGALSAALSAAACQLPALSAALSAAVCQLPALLADRAQLRAALLAVREQNATLRARIQRGDFPLTEDMTFPKETTDESIQDQPSNGG